MENFTPISAFSGGLLIELAATLLLLFNGRIAGISGILFGIGLTLSQMTNPDKVINYFLDLAGNWGQFDFRDARCAFCDIAFV